MKYIDKPSGVFVDRHVNESKPETNDVIMLTLDAEDFLEKSLYTIYREIPIRKLFVCDGGSKDQTLDILKKFPRVEVHVRPDFKTTGKALEFLLSLVQTEWFVVVDADIELFSGWYDEMCRFKTKYDILENSRRIRGFHFYREDNWKLDENCRSLDFCHMVRKTACENFHVDDDYMWRFSDILFRQVVEISGFKYGKINTTSHLHNETESIKYQSDNTKNYEKIVFEEPQHIIADVEKFKQWRIKHAKAIAKYLDPDHPLVKADKGNENAIKILDKEWITENAPKWIKYYTPVKNKEFTVESLVTQTHDERMNQLVKEVDNLRKSNEEYQKTMQSDSERMNQLVKEVDNLRKSNEEYQKTMQSDSERMNQFVKEVDDLKKTNAKYQKTIDDIHNSFTWRTLRKYDKIRDKALGRK